MSSSDEKDNYLSPVQASQKRKLENMSQNIAGGTSLKDLTSAMSKLLDIKLKNLPTKSDVDDNARLKEEVISLRSDREADKRTINMLLEQQKKKNLVVKGLKVEKSANWLSKL